MAAETIDCVQARRLYGQMEASMERACTRTAECRAANLAFDPCSAPVGYRDQERAGELLKLRAELHRRCRFVAAPCAAIFARPLCLDGECRTTDSLRELRKKSIVFLLKKKGRPLKAKTASLSVDTGIRCVTTPCPSRKRAATFRTDGSGRLLLPLSLIERLLEDSAMGPDGAALELEGVGHHPLELQELLADTRKLRVVDFP